MSISSIDIRLTDHHVVTGSDMQMGYNSDVKHNGVVVHIQTEDQGINAAKIETQVFFSGTILDSRILSYSELVEKTDDDNELNEEIQRRMKALHKYFHNQIQRGTYDHLLPRAPQEKPASSLTEQGEASERPEKPATPPEPTAAAGESSQEKTAAESSQRPHRKHAAFLGIDDIARTHLGDALLKAIR